MTTEFLLKTLKFVCYFIDKETASERLINVFKDKKSGYKGPGIQNADLLDMKAHIFFCYSIPQVRLHAIVK